MSKNVIYLFILTDITYLIVSSVSIPQSSLNNQATSTMHQFQKTTGEVNQTT